jgi:enamine deaminase RidA (YjgF/YER057c/UK114 family)
VKQERVDPGWAWTRKFNISAGVKLGDHVHLSGLVALDGAGNLVGEGDVHAQSRQVFRNIEEALASVGAQMADVTKITTWLTDMANYGDFAKARSEAFPNGVASTAICSPMLAMPGLLVEIEAIAVIGSGGA